MRTIKHRFYIKELNDNDLSAITHIHLDAFPDRALTLLGTEAVCRYYKWQLQGPHEIVALGAFLDNNLVGFCFGGVFHGALSGFLRKNKWFLIRHVLTHPYLLIRRLFREKLALGISVLRHLGRTDKAMERQEDHNKSFGILSIAVHSRFQGMGVGKLLINGVVEIARKRGFGEIRLSVHRENQRAICFYEQLGWEKVLKNDTWDGFMLKQLISTH